MNLNFFHLVPALHYGDGAARLAGPEMKKLGCKRPLVVTDKGVLDAGVCDPVLESLKEAGLETTLFTDVATNPDDIMVMAAAEAYKAANCDGMIGLGGGSPMDVAKSAAAVVTGGGHIRDYEDGAKLVTEPHDPLMFIPTTAGTGSEVVGGTIIIDTDRQFKMHIVAVPGHVALCDPELTFSLPVHVTAATGLDALSHAVGAYVSVENQPLADAYALYAIELVKKWLMRAVNDPSDREARGWLMVAALTAGISMKGGGSGEHAFAHGVNVLHKVHHGVACAIFLADVMDYNLSTVPERYAAIAKAMGVADTGQGTEQLAREGIQAVRDLVEEAKTPTLRDLGVKDDDLGALVDYVMQDEFHLGLNPVPITRADAEVIARTTLG